MTLFLLFRTFLMIGAISFGGGYAMIPVIEREITAHGWMTTSEFTEIIALAGMSPGPIATNSAIFVGYNVAGLPGAIVSAIGMMLPSLTLILTISYFFTNLNRHEKVQSAFYGLRPVIVGLIIYAAITFAYSNNMIQAVSFEMLSSLSIFALALFALIKLNMHPVYVIILSGITGVILYS